MKNKTLIFLTIIILIFSLRGNNNVKTEEIVKEDLHAIQSTPDTLLVKYKIQIEPLERESLRALIESANGLQEISYFPFIDVYLYRTYGDKEITLEELKKNPNIEYAEPDFIVHLDSKYPNDLYFNDLWGLHNTGQSGGTVDADIDAPEAWDLTTGSSNVVVAVIDSGVDYNHEDISANMWTNSGEIPNNGIDDDANGYVDDYYGINAITNSGNPMDDHKHGTHCSGTIAGVGNNGIGVVGVCWTAKIMALKFLTSQGSGATSNAIKCIQYGISKGAHIMSNSWGGYGFSQSLKDAINATKDAGILFIAAAGNDARNTDSDPHYPSAYDCNNIISVAATDRNDNLASFSNYGRISVDVAAPGVAIKSSTPNNNYESLQGTSMAAPHVAGLAALIKSYNPALNWQQIKNRILSGVEAKTSLATKILTGGRINAYNSLTSGDISSYSLNIQSSPSTNAYINVSPNDLNGQGNGYTNFSRIYSPYTAVALTAPPTHNEKAFGWWTLEGKFLSDQNSVSIPIDFNHTAAAQYLIMDLSEGVDNNYVTWTTGGASGGWYGQSATYYYGNDAVESRDIGDNQLTYIQTQVTGPDTLKFYWKVSSEINYDWLSFYIDGVRQVRMSGSSSWLQRTYSIPAGTHTLKWEYSKDVIWSSGSDCGWIDKVEIGGAQVSLGQAVDNTNLTWTTGGSGGGWYGQQYTYFYGNDAAESCDISDSQSNYIQTEVTGPESLKFYWKVSSQANYDYLSFYVDGVLQTRISGEVDWQQQTSSISSGTHTLKWEYSKNASLSSGSDCGWLDKVEYGPAPSSYVLTIATSTTGGGTGGTTNPSPGDHTYDSGASVSITASANTGYRFSGWTGNVPSGHGNDNPITIIMDSDKSITANFIRQYTLTIATLTTGGGTGGTTNPSAGTYTYDYQSSVAITALVNTNYRLSGWTGDVPSGHGNDNPLTISMDSDKSITANFIRQYTLTIATLTTYGINGGTTNPSAGSHKYDYTATATVTATPNTDYRFNGWTGDVPSGHENDNPLSIAMSLDKSITANFIRIIYEPLNFNGKKEYNRSLFQSQYINVLTWQANPKNVSPYLSIVKFKIYEVVGQTKTPLAEVNTSTLLYWHRGVEKDKQYAYAICEVNTDGREGDLATLTIQGQGAIKEKRNAQAERTGK